MTKPTKTRQIENIFKRHGGVIRTSETIAAGLHPRDLYKLESAGEIIKLSRGLYRLASLPPLGNPDLVSISRRVPHGVICLISALSFYGLTTQVPHEIYVAVIQGAEIPRIDYPPVRVFSFSGKAFDSGIEEHKVDGFPVRIYSREKTVADCFKFRNKIGLDVALAALKSYLAQKKANPDLVLAQAKICRVEKIITPYIEALL